MIGDIGLDGMIDTSHVVDGYVLALCHSDRKLKFQMKANGIVQNHDLPGDGTTSAYSLTMGSGAYEFRIFERIEGNTYAALLSKSVDVRLSSEDAPFLVPNRYCRYGSLVSDVAADIATSGPMDKSIAWRVCRHVADTVKYDRKKADELLGRTGYVPDPTMTLSEGTGVCFDYASLAVSMLRSVGTPAKLVVGWIEPEHEYHAWVVAKSGGKWVRYDPTLWSVGADPRKFKYVDRYVY